MRRSALALALAAAPALHAQVIEEIVVTAQKRAENVMDVPIALTAYSGDALKNLGTRTVTDIGRFTAGVDMNRGLYNTPLTDTLALRLMVNAQKSDGYTHNLTGRDVNDTDKRNVRAALLWDATDATEVLLRGSYEDMNQNSGALVTLNSAA